MRWSPPRRVGSRAGWPVSAGAERSAASPVATIIHWPADAAATGPGTPAVLRVVSGLPICGKVRPRHRAADGAKPISGQLQLRNDSSIRWPSMLKAPQAKAGVTTAGIPHTRFSNKTDEREFFFKRFSSACGRT